MWKCRSDENFASFIMFFSKICFALTIFSPIEKFHIEMHLPQTWLFLFSLFKIFLLNYFSSFLVRVAALWWGISTGYQLFWSKSSNRSSAPRDFFSSIFTRCGDKLRTMTLEAFSWATFLFYFLCYGLAFNIFAKFIEKMKNFVFFPL